MAIIKGGVLIEAGSVESLIHGVIYMYKGRSGQTFCTEQITPLPVAPPLPLPLNCIHSITNMMYMYLVDYGGSK